MPTIIHMKSIRQKLIAVGGILTGTIGNALAETNNTTEVFSPNLARGQQNLMNLQYADKAVWLVDTLYAVINWAAVIAILVLVIKFLFGGWDSIENEIRSRRAMMMIILIILGMRVGLMVINLVLSW